MAQRHPYDRLPEETSLAYSAFVLYRDMGVNRTQEKTLEILGKSAGYMRVLQDWSSQYNWVERATAWDDHIEAAARKVIERDAIRRKSEMLKRHSLTGKVLQQRGISYLEQHGVDKSSDAISAVKIGVEMERKSEGLPEYLLEIVNADDSELARQYAELLAAMGGAPDELGSDDSIAFD